MRHSSHHKVALADDALEIPQDLHSSVSSITDWTDYGVWGLALYDEQPPWFALVECIQVLFDRHRKLGTETSSILPGLPGDGRHEHFAYQVPLNMNLRYLLFRDQVLPRLMSRPRGTDQTALWGEFAAETAKATDPGLDLSYLRHVFEDMESLHRSLELLRSAEVEAFSSKRWTSRHLLPLGPNMIFADVTERDWKVDHLIFRRTGELLYLMLNRADREIRKELETLLRRRILEASNPWNDLARHIGQRPDGGGDDSIEVATRSYLLGYLPIGHMEVYDELARDWRAILRLDTLQIDSALDPLMRLSGLHQVIYMIQRAERTMGNDDRTFPPIVLDLAASARSNPVQKIAAGQYDSHHQLPRDAIDAFIDEFQASGEWRDVLDMQVPGHAGEDLVRKRFLWPKGRKGGSMPVPPAEHLEGLRANALKSSKHAVWSVLARHARNAGLVLARRGAGTWYAPNDGMLEALVLANVTGPTEMGLFLERLFSRYRIVVGPEQARAAFGNDSVSLEHMKANERRLEERLRMLGFIDRKSDDCAFVVNPFNPEN